ncbi:MAG: BMP family ABC transporter substrate-binding protein [Chloroflexota bacterium]|nr:BMP family ABC transporter substrate-binding protein [Chloroflexota bacterium]PLS78465.1 MAG: BMP family ABC transporter substrate-binding protein [Chloroflexota bacterium]
MRKTLINLLLTVLLLPILAACGAAGDGTSTGGTASGAAAGSAAASGAPTPIETEAASVAAGVAATTAATTAAETTTAETTETSAAGGADGSNIRVALVTDVGKVNDGTFNQFAFQGLQRAEQELGAQIDYIETQQQGDYEKNLEQFASGDYDLVIGVGFLMGDAIKAAASRHPDVNFAIVDFAYGDNPPANVKGLVFQEDQAGYLAGTMAALVSQSNTIGVVGGIEEVPAVKKFVQGYEAGAKAQKPDISVRQVYIPSFTDPAAGGEAARSMIAEGADVIFGAGGQTGSGAIQEAAKQGAFVIGVDQDEYTTTFRGGSTEGADKIVTSAIKRVDNAVFDTIQSVVEGNFSNELYVGTVENGGIDYAEAHDASAVVTADIKAKVDEVKEGLSNGSIQTGVQVQ